MIRPLLQVSFAACLSFTAANPAYSESGSARQVDDFHWEGVERIVAIGDLHGDYDQYRRVMESAGLINRRGKWDGGRTHLVQTGDIVDRGAGSREIIDHLQKLAGQAEKDGGHVHLLIGNHEAMNVYGDLRYVHPGEFAAFADRGSEKLRDRYYDGWMAQLREANPDGYALIQEQPGHREQWMASHPEGWVEHRIAWHPTGIYGKWVIENPVAVRINDTLFLHGGVSESWCDQGAAGMTEAVHTALSHFNVDDPGVLTDQYGPLWYRGMALDDESLTAPTVASVLECLGVERVVIGHTPTSGPIWPRFDGGVVQIDTGIAAHYGGHAGWLELTSQGARAGYPEFTVPVPDNDEARMAYLEDLIARFPANVHLAERRDALLRGDAEAPQTPGLEESELVETDVVQ